MRVSRAFTVLEVMVALAIFATAAVMLGSSYLNVLNAYELMARADRSEQELKFARAAVMTEPNRDNVEKGGDFESADGRRVSWKATIQPAPLPDLFDVTFECEINAPEMKAPERVQQTLRLLRPTWSEVDERDKLRAQVRERVTKLLEKSRP